MKTERPELNNNKPPEGTKLFSQRRNKEDINKSESTLNNPSISIIEPQGRQEQLLSQDSVENALSVSSQTVFTIDTSFNTASTMMMSEANAEILSRCFCRKVDNNPKIQLRNANTRSTTKYSITRDNQNRIYTDSLKLQIRKLTQEIAGISNDIENKKKQYSLVSHRVKVQQPTDESSEIQNPLSSNNVSAVVNDPEIKVDSEEEDDKKIIKLMDPEMRGEYLELSRKKKELQNKIKKEQLEIDAILAVKMRLEKQIELLSTQVVEVEEEKKETERNRVNHENKRDQGKQDNSEITVNEQEKEENDRQTKDQQRLEQFETSSKEDQFEVIITDDALIEEIHKRIAAFENKLDEIMEAHNELENFIRKNREQINLNQLEDKAVKSIKRIIHFQDRTKLIN